jgi:perosamine synthetase
MPTDGPVIPHSRPTLGPEDVQAVADVMRSGHLAQGEQVRRFEEELSSFLGRRGGVAASSGTSALHLALLALGVGPGDEVLVPSYTCVALLHAVEYVRATPQFVDIDRDGYNLSPLEAQRHLTSRTRAIIVPHMFGMPVDLEPLASLGVPLIEDCAQALGATYRGSPVGSVGIISVASFYATKVMTTGEGGMLFSDSDLILRHARDLRDYDGRTTHEVRFNYKMTDMQAALGLSQLRRLPGFLVRRQALASQYATRFRHLPMRLPVVKPSRTHIFYRYVVGVDDADQLARRLNARGVQCKAPVCQPLHRYSEQGGFPETENAARTALSIPIYPSLTDHEVEKIVETLSEEIEGQEEPSRRASSSHS